MTIEKDICYLYHEQSEYGALMPDLDWGSVYSLPYWKLLKEYSDSDDSFKKLGCMVFVLLMALDKIDGSGDYLSPVYEQCIDASRSVIPHSVIEDRLQTLVVVMLEKAMSKTSFENAKIDDVSWVYKEIIQVYFGSMA